MQENKAKGYTIDRTSILRELQEAGILDEDGQLTAIYSGKE